jgi:catechol 2,3-dioxygenase-like lactoylglutathione lyase family enzyme
MLDKAGVRRVVFQKEEAMLPIRGVYEVAIRVKDMPRAEAFYRDVLGLAEGLRDERRNWVFLWAGGQAGMVVLQEDQGAWPAQHIAFTVDEADIERAAEALRAHGVAVRGPVFHAWMPAKSIYFADPDGHALELCAPTNMT